MSKRKRKKSFAQKYSSDFEKLSLDIVKSFINEENIKAAETTREKKDGGFDGIIIYKDMSSEDRVHLIEAKLRTEKKDLPLSDFSKTIIIAVNSDASCVYISTNLYFSEKTIAELESFIRSTGMDIQTIDGNEISKWINEANSSIIKKYPVDFINTLKTYEYSDKTAPCKKLTISGKHTLTVQKIEYLQLYGAERKNMEKSLLNVLKSNPATIVVSGYNGTGKHTFINNILNDLVSSKKKFLIANIEADKITSKKDFAYRLLSRFWGCSYKSTISFLENKDENSKLIEKFCSKEIANSLNSVFDSNEKDIDLDILFSYLYDLYKSKRENKYIFYLSGVSEICDKEIQSFVLTFIRKFTNVISILLTINDDAVNDDAIQNEQNYFFKSSLLESKNILKESLPNLDGHGCLFIHCGQS